MYRFEALELALQLIRSLRKVLPLIAEHDPDLARHIREAASSAALNIGEGNQRVGRARTNHFNIASGSAEEVRTGLRVAEAWGYVTDAVTAEPLALADRLVAMLWRLSR